MIVQLQRGLKGDGITVSPVKLCRWFGVARRTVYYRTTKAASFQPAPPSAP
jgi:putative transposase